MSNDPIVLSSLTAAVSVLGNEYLKGIATDAGKATWTGLKSLLGWATDPTPEEIPEKVASAVATSPEIVEQLLYLLQSNQTGSATALVGRLEVNGGKVVVAGTISHLEM